MQYYFGSLLDYRSQNITYIRNLQVTSYLKLLCMSLVMIAVGWHVWTLKNQLELSAEYYISAKPSSSPTVNIKTLPTVTSTL